MSLTDSLPAPTIASSASVDYLIGLLEERGVYDVDPLTFGELTQKQVSSMIDVENDRPATDEQLARVAELVKRLRIPGTVTSKNRGQAARQIKTMEADLARIKASRRELSDDDRSSAESLLDTLLNGVQSASDTTTEAELVAAGVQDDDIPF